MKSVDYWCNEAVRLANPPLDVNWASMKDPMAWLIEQIQKDAAQAQAARDEEISRLKEALRLIAFHSTDELATKTARAALNGEKE